MTLETTFLRAISIFLASMTNCSYFNSFLGMLFPCLLCKCSFLHSVSDTLLSWALCLLTLHAWWLSFPWLHNWKLCSLLPRFKIWKGLFLTLTSLLWTCTGTPNSKYINLVKKTGESLGLSFTFPNVLAVWHRTCYLTHFEVQFLYLVGWENW